MWGPVDVLQDAIKELEAGTRKANKLVVLFLDDVEGQAYNTGFSQSGLRMSELVALLEVTKFNIIQDEMKA